MAQGHDAGAGPPCSKSEDLAKYLDLPRHELRISSRAEDEEPVTILIEIALAALLVLGSALTFKEILDLDAPARPAAKRARPTLRQASRALKKAA